MKYNININQKAFSKIAPELDVIDGAILDFIRAMCTAQYPAIEKHRITNKKGKWTWVDYKLLSDEMPMINITAKSAITARVQKIEKAGFVETMRGQGHLLYVKLLPLIDRLTFNSKVLTFAGTNVNVRKKERFKKKNINIKNNFLEKKSKTHGNGEINELIELFKGKTELEGLGESNGIARKYAWNLIQKYGMKLAEEALDWLLEDEFWQINLTKISQLWYQMPKFLKETNTTFEEVKPK